MWKYRQVQSLALQAHTGSKEPNTFATAFLYQDPATDSNHIRVGKHGLTVAQATGNADSIVWIKIEFIL